MEYYQESVIRTSCHKPKIVKNSTKKILMVISILCISLVGIDMILIYEFAHVLQNMV